MNESVTPSDPARRTKPLWRNGQRAGLLIQRLWVRVPSAVKRWNFEAGTNDMYTSLLAHAHVCHTFIPRIGSMRHTSSALVATV